jgi:hypothetical protein
MAKQSKKKAPKDAEQPMKLMNPFWDGFASLFRVRERWFRKHADQRQVPAWMRPRVNRTHSSEIRFPSFAHLAGASASTPAKQARRPESRRSMLERERREGRREAIEQLKRVVDLPEAKGHEILAVHLAIDGVPEGAVRKTLQSVAAGGRRGAGATWAPPQPVDARSEVHGRDARSAAPARDVRSEVLERAARSAEPQAAPSTPAPAGDTSGVASGEDSVDPGASTPPP